MTIPWTYFALGSTLANMVNIERSLLTTETIRVPNGGRVPYVGSVNLRAGDGKLSRDGYKNGKWLISVQAQAEFAAFLNSQYSGFVTSAQRFYVSTLDEFGHYSPYFAYVERPSTADGTLTIPDSGGWFTGVVISLTDAQLQSISKTANYTVTTSDRLIYCNTNGGDITLALPAVSGVTVYTIYSAIKTDAAHNLVFDPNGSEKIFGASTVTVTALNARTDFYTDGLAWYTI